ncbi:unnamed protein product, partial [marine sediment metagenome]
DYVVFQLANDIAFDERFQFIIHNLMAAIDYHCDIHYAVTPAA